MPVLWRLVSECQERVKSRPEEGLKCAHFHYTLNVQRRAAWQPVTDVAAGNKPFFVVSSCFIVEHFNGNVNKALNDLY